MGIVNVTAFIVTIFGHDMVVGSVYWHGNTPTSGTGQVSVNATERLILLGRSLGLCWVMMEAPVGESQECVILVETISGGVKLQ